MQQVGRGFGVAHMLAGRLFSGAGGQLFAGMQPWRSVRRKRFYGRSIAAPQLLPR